MLNSWMRLGVVTVSLVALQACGGDETDGEPVEPPVEVEPEAILDVALSDPNDGRFDRYPSLAIAPDGRLAVAWTSYALDGVDRQIVYGFSEDGGESWSMQVLAAPAGRADHGAVAVDQHGHFYLAFRSPHDPPPLGFYLAQAPAGELAFGEPVELGSGTDGSDSPHEGMPHMVVGRDDMVRVAWRPSIGGAYSYAAGSFPAVEATDLGDATSRASLCVADAESRTYVVYRETMESGVRAAMSVVGTGPFGDIGIALGAGVASRNRPLCVTAPRGLWIAYASGPTDDDAQTTSTTVHLAHVDEPTRQVAELPTLPGGLVYQAPQLRLAPDESWHALAYCAEAPESTGALIRFSLAAEADAWEQETLHEPIDVLSVSSADPLRLGEASFVVHEGRAYGAFLTNAPGVTRVRFFRAPL